MWKKIAELLRLYASIPSTRPSIHTYRPLFEPGANHFEGIFAYLKRETGSNCAVNGTIEVSATKTCCGTLAALFDVTDRGGSSTSYWHHANVKDGWLQIDFKDRRLAMTHYALHNNLCYVREQDFLKTWTMEGSMTGEQWTVIDSRVNDERLHGKDKVEALFTCNGDTKHCFRFIRLFQRGTSHDPSSYKFLISQLEVFGHLQCPTSGQR
jgi:hypothetical protein